MTRADGGQHCDWQHGFGRKLAGRTGEVRSGRGADLAGTKCFYLYTELPPARQQAWSVLERSPLRTRVPFVRWGLAQGWVGVRVSGSGPTKVMFVLSAERQRGSNGMLGVVTKGMPLSAVLSHPIITPPRQTCRGTGQRFCAAKLFHTN
eukprot:365856-Chlamydomonas_euryale.AAC.13